MQRVRTLALACLCAGLLYGHAPTLMVTCGTSSPLVLAAGDLSNMPREKV
jgi:hypothetical protein